MAVLIAFGLLAAYQLLSVLKLIVIAMLLALVLRTIMRRLERFGAPAWLSVVLLLAGLAALGRWSGS